MKIKIGMRVTVKYPVEAYYSGYCGESISWFKQGMIGTVVAVNVPNVTGRNRCFSCVDYEDNGKMRRCAVYNDNIKVIK